jgi:hypothetical protein
MLLLDKQLPAAEKKIENGEERHSVWVTIFEANIDETWGVILISFWEVHEFSK